MAELTSEEREFLQKNRQIAKNYPSLKPSMAAAFWIFLALALFATGGHILAVLQGRAEFNLFSQSSVTVWGFVLLNGIALQYLAYQVKAARLLVKMGDMLESEE